ERCRDLVHFQTDSTSFQVLLCISGCGVLLEENAAALHFFRGDCIFIPADSETIRLHGKAQFLKVRC
ncbi:MAG: class I mannose-6-phosphate isomerase, partial [Lachnospiraceae bacterium]|nr:class I mannose-6-phosphate isomerase [Lachnospiraceae bacterium]